MALHTKILFGLVLGAAAGGLVNLTGDPVWITRVGEYVRPVGTLFVRLITMIAAPLVLTTLIVGASSITEPKPLMVPCTTASPPVPPTPTPPPQATISVASAPARIRRRQRASDNGERGTHGFIGKLLERGAAGAGAPRALHG